SAPGPPRATCPAPPPAGADPSLQLVRSNRDRIVDAVAVGGSVIIRRTREGAWSGVVHRRLAGRLVAGRGALSGLRAVIRRFERRRHRRPAGADRSARRPPLAPRPPPLSLPPPAPP